MKLISLANNNPNENEANAAARKVCRMLVELKVNFTTRTTPKQPEVKTWADVRRSEESFWKSQPQAAPPPRYDPVTDWIKDYFNQRESEAKRAAQAQQEYEQYEQNRERRWYYERPPQEAKIPRPEVRYNPQNDTYHTPEGRVYTGVEWENREPKRKKEKRLQKCVECGQDIMTGYVGPVFTCNACHWAAWRKSKEGVPDF